MGKKKAKESEAPVKEEFDPVELVTKKPQTVILMLQSTEENVLQAVCEALSKYAEKSQENKAQLLNLGALEHLTKLICHEDKVVKRAATMCVGTVASEASARKIIRKTGCLKSLLNLLSPEEEMICHEFATLALSYLAEEYVNKVEIFEKHGLQLLVQHLSSSDCDVQKNSLQAICLLVEEFQNRAAMKDLNALEPLLKLIDSEYPVIQELALSTLIVCAQDSENRAALRDLDAMTKLVEIIGNEALADLHILCLRCLANCLEDTETLKLIQSTGVFDKLLAFISGSSNSEIQQFTMLVIAAAAKVEENRRIFYEMETEKTLINFLSSDSIQVAISSVKALATLSENLSSKEKIGKLDGIPPILKLLNNDNAEVKEVASLAIANLTNSNHNNCQIVMEKNAIDLLIKLLSDKSTHEVQCNIAACISNLAANETWRSEIKKHNIIKGLLETLKSDDQQVQLNGCQALAAFMCDADSRYKLLCIDEGVQHVVNLLKSSNSMVRRSAAWVLALCSVDTSFAEEITKYDGLKLLQSMNLSSRKQPMIEMALERLLDNNLPAKYAINGVLKFDNILENVFYDIGKIRPGDPFLTLSQLYDQEINDRRPVILVNPKQKIVKKHSKDEGKTPMPIKATAEKGEKRGRSKNERRLSKSRMGRDKEENRDSSLMMEKGQLESLPSESILYRDMSSNAPYDMDLLSQILDVQKNIGNRESTEEQIGELAKYVSDKMGGSISKSELSSFSYELHISELKTELGTNVIPIGRINQGIYYHRALLFKALADQISLPCSLIRGDYGRTWNEVQVVSQSQTGQPLLPPKIFVVDLMHAPGELYSIDSPQATAYQRI